MDMYFARQPIFDTRKKVLAYELLYRSSQDNQTQAWDDNVATSVVINNSSLLMDLKTITKGKRGFINFTKKLIEDGIPMLYANDRIVVEILEDIIPDQTFIAAIKDLKNKGYTIALDDFTPDYPHKEVIDLADIIKVDFINTTPQERRRIAGAFKHRKIRLLAEKVETEDEFTQAAESGYTLFQGFFFAKPSRIKGKDIKGNPNNLLNIMVEANKEEPDFNELSDTIETDLSLTYKILRVVNSPAFFGITKINSVQHALVRLGINELRKIISLLFLVDFAKGKKDEVIRLSMVRAKAFELMSKHVGLGYRKHEFFLVGIFSLLDVLMQRPMQEVIGELPLNDEIKRTLLVGDNELGRLFKSLTSYEKADWDDYEQICRHMKVDCRKMPDIYYQALAWAEEVWSLE